MRRSNRAGALVCLTIAFAMASSHAALAVDIRDPDLFGPEEPWAGPRLRPGTRGLWVTELQRELRAAGFQIGPIDGTYGESTVVAVRTFQKLHGLPVDASFKAEHWALLSQGVDPPGNGEPDRVEIDLGKQILFHIRAGDVAAILPVSTASGHRYINFWGRSVRSHTPEGRFELYNRRYGWHESYLGEMWNPFYFVGGYAIHGSTSVPDYPASHGCVRVRISDMRHLKEVLELGLPVYVYGDRFERHEVAPPERLDPSKVMASAGSANV